MITPAYSPTATERVLPRLALDFTTGVLDPRVTVTRALNTATRVNSSGLVEGVNANLPRFDYDPVTLAPKGLLIEETRTNLVLYSVGYGGTWGGDTSGGTAGIGTPNYGTAPDGTMTATRVQLDRGAGTFSRWLFNLTGLASSVYTGSIWMKTTSGTGTANVGLRVGNDGVNCVVTGQWKRFSLPTSAATTSAALQIISFTSIPGTDVTADILIWGGQVEAGAFATSYIPTTTTSLTRNADVVAMTGTNFSSWWQATTGAMTVRARQLSATSTRPWTYISDGTANNIISLRGNVTDPELYIKATTDQVQIDAGTLAANTSYGFSGAWNTNDCAAAFNGGSAGTDASATIPTVDRMLIGSDGTNYLSGWAEKISYWPQRITNAETQAFSK